MCQLRFHCIKDPLVADIALLEAVHGRNDRFSCSNVGIRVDGRCRTWVCFGALQLLKCAPYLATLFIGCLVVLRHVRVRGRAVVRARLHLAVDAVWSHC